MSIYYFPKDDPDFAGVVSFSPVDTIVCPQKPFGDVSAEEYLEFARGDLAQRHRRGLVNALGNAKRCFHYHADRLLYRFGLRDATLESHFPSKIDLLRDLHVVSGTLLRVFNRERNAMEHDYSAPTQEVVEGSIDLCELFLLATECYLRRTPARMRVVLADDERDLILLLEPGANCIQKFVVHGSTLEETQHGKKYKERLFKLREDNLSDGLSIEARPNEDIPLRLETREGWLSILRMFSAAARESHRFPQHPDEPMAIIQHAVPWRVTKEVFKAIAKGENS